MPIIDKTNSAESWSNHASISGNVIFTKTARRLRIGGAGNLYLIPVGSGTEQLFATSVLAGEQFDVQCDGIGSSTTCTLITVHY